MRRQFTPTQKAAVALAALKGDKTINQIAAQFEVHPTQVKQWRDTGKTALPEAFTDKRKRGNGEAVTATQSQVDELHRVIGVRDAELEWLKKKIHGLGL
jgi:transposase-like protein